MNIESDCIRVEELRLLASLGVDETERAHLQPIALSLTLWPRKELSRLNDNINATVNYATICDEVRSTVSARSDKLIETLAEEIAVVLLAKFPLARVCIELRKFVIPDAKHVAVILTRDAAVP